MMNNQPLSLAVVGHTNTGKTSLLRTLLRDSGFGEVKNAPSTTRHVEEAAITDGADTLLYLYDTPGLEDAGGVLDWLETHTDARADGIERLQKFLDSHGAHHDFNQEAKVLRQHGGKLVPKVQLAFKIECDGVESCENAQVSPCQHGRPRFGKLSAGKVEHGHNRFGAP